MEEYSLKPCPFCGRMPKLIKTEYTYLIGEPEDKHDGYSVECEEYDCWFNPSTPHYDIPKLAVICWNLRGVTAHERFDNFRYKGIDTGDEDE